MVHEIEEYIDPGEDDVRAYPLLATTLSVIFGRDRLPSGVMPCHSEDSGPTADSVHVKGQLPPTG